MDCQLFERQMQRGIDHMLAAHEHEDMLKHAADCPDCAALLQDMTALDSLLQTRLVSVEPPADFAVSVMNALPAPYKKPALRVLLPRKQWQRWAGAAAAALLVTAGVYGLLPSAPEQGISNNPLHPGIAQILNERKVITPQAPQQPENNAGVQVAVITPQLGVEEHLPEAIPDNTPDNNTEVTPVDDPSTVDVDPNTPAEELTPFTAPVDLPMPAAFNPQPEGVLSPVLLVVYEDCDAMLPSLNAEGLVEFYIKYKGVSHLWTQTLSAEEAPVYGGQVKSLPSVADITGSVDEKDADGNSLVSAVSPDGRTLAVSRGGEHPGLWLCGNVEDTAVEVMLAGDGREIPDAVGGGKVLSWSPDGNKLLYTDAAGKLFVCYLAEKLNFELYNGTVTCASWAEDSMTVVFAGKEAKDQRSAIYTVLLF